MKYLVILFAILIVGCSGIMSPAEPIIPEKILPTAILKTGVIFLDGLTKQYAWGNTFNNEIHICDTSWNKVGLIEERPLWVDSIRFHFYWEKNHALQNFGISMVGPSNIFISGENQKYLCETLKPKYNMWNLGFVVFFSDSAQGSIHIIAELFINDSSTINLPPYLEPDP